jgi:predicted Fe-Mo cluster-binding NifX family protein
MKLIITTGSPSLDSDLDPRFGRAAHFLIVDTENLEWQAVANPALNASGGAGIQAAQFVANQGCDAVVSGDFGPNAFNALTTVGLTMYLMGNCSTPIEVVQKFKNEQLERLESSPKGRGRRVRW